MIVAGLGPLVDEAMTTTDMVVPPTTGVVRVLTVMLSTSTHSPVLPGLPPRRPPVAVSGRAPGSQGPAGWYY